MKIIFNNAHFNTVIRNCLRMWLGDNVVIKGVWKPWWLLTQNRLGFWFPNLKSLASIPSLNYRTVVPPSNFPSLAHPLSIASIINSRTVPHPLPFVTSLTLVMHSGTVKSLSQWCNLSVHCAAIITQVKTFPSLNIHFFIDCKWNGLPLILERTIWEGGRGVEGSWHLSHNMEVNFMKYFVWDFFY